jgi:hypothetical protein
MRRRRVFVGASALLGALAACEPQTVRLFSDVGAVPDAGTPRPPDRDTGVTPPPPSIEQPACQSDACRSCVADSDPCIVAGTQWLCHPVTGECALPCEPVSDSSQCPREQSCHPEYRVCVDCLVNGDCGNVACDTQRNECVECTSDAQCNAPTPACDTDAQRCVACTADRHCEADGLVCNTSTQVCVQCVSNADCNGTGIGDDPTPACDTSRNVCVECLSDDDCRSDPDKPFCRLSELECDDDRNDD